MPHWYDPLLAVLAEQPPETLRVTLTLAQVETLGDGSLPASALTRGCWWNRTRGHMADRCQAAGWRVVHVHGRPLTITFERTGLDPMP